MYKVKEVKELNNSQRQEISQAVHDWKKVMRAILAVWESMGCSRQPNLKDLLKHLLQSDELAVAAFISKTLLKEVPITEENKMEKLD